MRQWGQFWTRWVSATFLRSYLDVAGQGDFLPRTQQELQGAAEYLSARAPCFTAFPTSWSIVLNSWTLLSTRSFMP